MLCQPSTGHHSTASALNSVSTTCSVRVLHGAAIAGRALLRRRGGSQEAPGRRGRRPSASRSGRARGGAAPAETPLPPAGLAPSVELLPGFGRFARLSELPSSASFPREGAAAPAPPP